MHSIPHNFVQCAFNFEVLDLQPIDDVVLQVNDVPPREKQCCRCKQYFPATTDYFCRSKGRKDGLNVCCKACRHAIYLENVANDPEFNRKKTQRDGEIFLSKSPEEQEQIRARRA